MVALSVAADIGRKQRSGLGMRVTACLMPTALALGICTVVALGVHSRAERRQFIRDFSTEYRGDFACPTVERWAALSVQQRGVWHRHFLASGFTPFEKSAVCYVPPAGVSAWETLGKLPESRVWAAGRVYGGIACPKADRIALASAEEVARWKSVGSSLGPAIPESNLCFDP